MKVHNLVVTGSLTSGGENISTISSSVSTTVTELSSSLTSSIGSLSSSMVTMVTNMSSSITSSIGSMSSSMSSRFDTLESTTGSINTFTSSASGRLNSVEGKTGSYATTGSNTFVGLQTIQGSIVPASHATYDLGSAGYNFRHLYLSSASLYIDGTKVLGSTTQELQITTDNGQSFKILEAGSDTITLQSADGNITLATSGGGDVILDPTSGIIALKGTTTIYAGNRVLSSDGNPIHFGNSVTMTGSLIVTGYIETQELRTTYISSSILYRSGSTKFGDELTDTHAFSGSVLISGSLSVPGSGLISGSSQITYSGLSGVPSGIISGSAQLPSGVVSGSVQVDVMSTTNIARLATTGSNTFTGAQTINASNIGRINLGNTTGSTKTAGAIIAQTSPSYGATGKLGFSVTTWGVNTDYDLTEVMAIDMRAADTKGATIYMNPFGGGRFGFGTQNPASVFHISGSTNDIGVRMTNSTASRTYMSYVDTNGNYIVQDATADSNRLTISTGGTITSVSTIQSLGGSIQTYNQTSGYGVGFYFPGSTTPSIFADNVLRIYQRVEIWGGGGGYYLDVRNSSGDQKIKFDGNGGNSFLNSGNFNIGYSSDQGAKLYVQANQASYTAYFEQVGGATSSYGGVRITTNSTGVNSLYIDNAGTERFSVKGSGVVHIQNALGIGYSDPQYTLQVNGNIGLRANSQNIKAITGTGWGYSPSSYKVVMLGDTANNVTVSIGYDPSGNSNSAFSGDGREILFRNGASFATPTSGNTAFHLNTLVMKDGKIGVGTADPSYKVHAYAAADTSIVAETTGQNAVRLQLINEERTFILTNNPGDDLLSFYYAGANRMQFNTTNQWFNSGDTGFGTTSPAHKVDVNGNIRINQSVAYLYFTATTTNRYLAYNGADTYWRADGIHYFEKTSGYKGTWDASSNLTVNGTITESSALRYKENINPLENSLEKVSKLRGVSYVKKETGLKEFGFIAEEVNEIIPELVLRNPEGEIESVAYGRFVSVLAEAIKELKAEIEVLKQNK